MSSNSVASVLREYERYCYQIAYFLLREEGAAVASTRRALLKLAHTPEFTAESHTRRLALAKRAVIQFSLEQRSATACRAEIG